MKATDIKIIGEESVRLRSLIKRHNTSQMKKIDDLLSSLEMFNEIVHPKNLLKTKILETEKSDYDIERVRSLSKNYSNRSPNYKRTHKASNSITNIDYSKSFFESNFPRKSIISNSYHNIYTKNDEKELTFEDIEKENGLHSIKKIKWDIINERKDSPQKTDKFNRRTNEFKTKLSDILNSYEKNFDSRNVTKYDLDNLNFVKKSEQKHPLIAKQNCTELEKLNHALISNANVTELIRNSNQKSSYVNLNDEKDDFDKLLKKHELKRNVTNSNSNLQTTNHYKTKSFCLDVGVGAFDHNEEKNLNDSNVNMSKKYGIKRF